MPRTYQQLLAALGGPTQAAEAARLYPSPQDLLRAQALTGRLAAAVELARLAQAPTERRMIRHAGDIQAACADMEHLPTEQFRILLLNAKHRIMRSEIIVQGGLTTCSVLPREVFAPALIAGCPAIVAVHNHPSGDPTPSADDLALTARLKEAGKCLGIKLLDHVVIGEAGSFHSMVESGTLEVL